MVVYVDVLKEGYSTFLPELNTSKANGTCTLIRDNNINIVVDTLTAWDRDILVRELNKKQLNCDDIHYVVCTHGHSDHVGNLNLFTKATHIVGYSVSHADEYNLHPFDEGTPYTISENVEVIPTPGHTLSDVSVIVRNTSHGTIVVAGDLFERMEDIENPDLWSKIAGSENPDLQFQNREKILNVADYVIPGHGPMFKVTPELKNVHKL